MEYALGFGFALAIAFVGLSHVSAQAFFIEWFEVSKYAPISCGEQLEVDGFPVLTSLPLVGICLHDSCVGRPPVVITRRKN